MKYCENCKKEIVKKWPYQLKKVRFCSHKCANSVLWKNNKFTEEHKVKLQEGRKKFVYTPEIRAKMSVIKKTHAPWNRGKHTQSNNALSVWRKKKNGGFGKDHPNWKGGIAYFKIRNIRLRENGGFHTQGEWETLKSQYNWTCPCCRKQNELVKDHIIPLAKGGSNNIENIQPLCRSCNAKKHTKIIKY